MKKSIGRYLIILLAVLVLWNTIVIKPLKIFTVFLHELGHAFMAFVFGYGIRDFKINFNESGYTVAQPKGWFSAFMIANGGYLGSVFFALLILYLKRTPVKRYILGFLAILFLGISLKFSGFSFTLLYSIIFAVFVLLLYMIHNEKIDDWVIDIIGITSVAYAVYDTFIDTIIYELNKQLHIISGWNGRQMTDAVQLAGMTHIPAAVWGILWLLAAVFSVYTVLIKQGGKAARGRRQL